MEICGVFVIVYRRVYAGVLNIFFCGTGNNFKVFKVLQKGVFFKCRGQMGVYRLQE